MHGSWSGKAGVGKHHRCLLCSSLDTGLWVLSEAGHGARLHGRPEAHPTFHCPLQSISPKRSLLQSSCVLARMLALNAYQALGRGSSTFVLNKGVQGRISHFKYSASSGRRQHSRKCYFRVPKLSLDISPVMFHSHAP